MAKFEPLRPSSSSSQSFNDYAYLLFKSQIFVRNLSRCPQPDQHAEWRNAVRESNAMYMTDIIESEKCSAMDDAPDSSPVGTSSSRSVCCYPLSFPLIPNDGINQLLHLIGGMDSAGILQYIDREGVRSKSAVSVFWDSPIEAIRRVFGNEQCEQFIVEAFGNGKRNERGFQNKLFCEFFKLKLRIVKCESTEQLTAVSLDIEPMRDAYQGLSELELRTGHSAMAFLQEQLLPLVIREVPFFFIQQIASQAFDYTPNLEDQARLWALNEPLVWLRKENSAHVWSDSVLRTNPRLKPQTLPMPNSESICSVYEAPWEAPWVPRDGRNEARRTRKPAANATARFVKLEGFKQGYVKTNTTDDPSVSTAMCLFPEDTFEIRNRDLFSSNWESSIPNPDGVPMLMNDILNDLTANSPVPSVNHSPVTAVKRRRMEQSPDTISKKLMELSIGENSPNVQNEHNVIHAAVAKESKVSFSTSPKTEQKMARSIPEEILSERAKRAKRDSWDEYDKLNMI